MAQLQQPHQPLGTRKHAGLLSGVELVALQRGAIFFASAYDFYSVEFSQ